MPTRRRFLVHSAAGTAAAALTGFASGTLAQAGNKTVRIIVGAAAGGGTDVIARLIAERLRGSYAPAVIVENRPGANGQIAVDLVKNGDADGSLILFTPDFRMTVFPHSHRKLSYDPVRDFAPVAICAKSTLAVSAGPMLPASVTSLAEFLQWAKANPKQATYATTSAGGTPHLTGVMLSRASGVELTPVHYKGGADPRARRHRRTPLALPAQRADPDRVGLQGHCGGTLAGIFRRGEDAAGNDCPVERRDRGRGENRRGDRKFSPIRQRTSLRRACGICRHHAGGHRALGS
ncbi:MAG: twin-arginine translocation signal domain-containing protein [Betaproteobacteria bacterium]|nr:twin-arginine translocation signal domain-containing protein [Betaproteobacteria bacterium]